MKTFDLVDYKVDEEEELKKNHLRVMTCLKFSFYLMHTFPQYGASLMGQLFLIKKQVDELHIK